MTQRPPRKAIPLGVKVLALEATLCKLLGCEKIEYDHRPGLEQREVNEAGTDYEPAQLDPKFIEPVPVNVHKERTKGDTKARGKIRRNAKKNAEFNARMAEKQAGQRPLKAKSKWPTRKFPKRQK